MSIHSARIGVLNIQGSIEEHLASLKRLKVRSVPVKNIADLAKVDGLIIPGGESTTIEKLLEKYGLGRKIWGLGKHGMPLWGTCAGAILLARQFMDIEVVRNFYGRQLDSFETLLPVPLLGKRKVPAVFIRAPAIKKASPKAKILAKYGGLPVMLRQKNILITTFHPELTRDLRIHKYFLSLVKKYAAEKSKN